MYSNQFVQLKLKLIYFVQIIRNSMVRKFCKCDQALFPMGTSCVSSTNTGWHIDVHYVKLCTHIKCEVKHNWDYGLNGLGQSWQVAVSFGNMYKLEKCWSSGEYPSRSSHDHRGRSLRTPDLWPTIERVGSLPT